MEILDSDQLELIGILAAARKHVKEEFHVRAGDDVLRLYHPGLERHQRGMLINPTDLKALERAGLIVTTGLGERGDRSFEITPDGSRYASFFPEEEIEDKTS